MTNQERDRLIAKHVFALVPCDCWTHDPECGGFTRTDYGEHARPDDPPQCPHGQGACYPAASDNLYHNHDGVFAVIAAMVKDGWSYGVKGVCRAGCHEHGHHHAYFCTEKLHYDASDFDPIVAALEAALKAKGAL